LRFLAFTLIFGGLLLKDEFTEGTTQGGNLVKKVLRDGELFLLFKKKRLQSSNHF
jgi:hypothetical protein